MTSLDDRPTMREVAARLATLSCPQNPCVACKSALTPADANEIRFVSAELKRISGRMFGEKHTVQGYNLRDLHKRLDAVLLGRKP